MMQVTLTGALLTPFSFTATLIPFPDHALLSGTLAQNLPPPFVSCTTQTSSYCTIAHKALPEASTQG